MYSYHYTAAELKRRGWTDALIREFLPFPDETVPNPWYRRAAPIRLYLHTKVIEIEKSEAWKEKKLAVDQRKASARKGVSTKLEKMHREIEAMKFEIPYVDHESLIKRACDHYNFRKAILWEERGYEYTLATSDSDIYFLHRITVNYVRHELSPYDRKLAQRYGKVGVRESYGLISKKIFEAILLTYPWLADECERQIQSREHREGYESKRC